MHKLLLLKAFKKAEKDIGSVVMQRKAKHLSDYILESSGQPYGEKILCLNYKKAKKEPTQEIEFKQFVVQSLSEYLGYKDFVEFSEQNDPLNFNQANGTNDKGIWTKFLKYFKQYVMICIMILVLLFLLNDIFKEKLR